MSMMGLRPDRACERLLKRRSAIGPLASSSPFRPRRVKRATPSSRKWTRSSARSRPSRSLPSVCSTSSFRRPVGRNCEISWRATRQAYSPTKGRCHDPQGLIRRIPALFAHARSQDWKATKPWDVQNAGPGQATRAGHPVLQAPGLTVDAARPRRCRTSFQRGNRSRTRRHPYSYEVPHPGIPLAA